MGILAFVRMAINVVLGKAVTLMFGSAGLFLLGQFQSLSLFVQNFSTGAIHNGIIKYWQEEQDKNGAFRHSLVSIAWKSSLTLGLLLLLFAKPLGQFLFGEDRYSFSIALLGLCSPLVAFGQLVIHRLNAAKEYKGLSMANNLWSISTVIGAIVGAWVGGLSGMLYGLSLSFLLTACLFALLFRTESEWLLRRPWFTTSTIWAQRFLRYALAALVSVSVVSISQIFIRKGIVLFSGLADAGFWEGISRISNLYLFFISFLFSGYFLPRFSSKTSWSEVAVELKHGIVIFCLFFMVIGVVLLPILPYLIPLLFTEEFAIIATLFIYQLAGDWLKSISWLFTNYLVALNKIGSFLVFETLGNLLNLAFVLLLVPVSGLKGAVMAYPLAWLIQMCSLGLFFFMKIRKEISQ